MNIKKIGIVALGLMLFVGVGVFASTTLSNTLEAEGTVNQQMIELTYTDVNVGNIGDAGKWNIGEVFEGQRLVARINAKNIGQRTITGNAQDYIEFNDSPSLQYEGNDYVKLEQYMDGVWKPVRGEDFTLEPNDNLLFRLSFDAPGTNFSFDVKVVE